MTPARCAYAGCALPPPVGELTCEGHRAKRSPSPAPWRWTDNGELRDANDKAVPFEETKALLLLVPEMREMLLKLALNGCPRCGNRDGAPHLGCDFAALVEKIR